MKWLLWTIFLHYKHGTCLVALRTIFLSGSEVGIFFHCFFFSFSSLQESLTPAHRRRLQVSFDLCFARCKHGTCSVALQTISLGGSEAGIFPPLGFFLFFQPAGISHPCSLKKVAGFLRSMLRTLQTWNLFGRDSVVLRTIFLGGYLRGWHFFPTGFFSFPACRNLSPLLAEESCRFSFDSCFARCKRGTCSDEIWWFCGGGWIRTTRRRRR